MSSLTLKGRPETLVLPDGRRRITHLYDVLAPALESANLGTPASPGSSGVMLAWGTAEPDFTGARLIRQFAQRAPQNAGEQTWVRVYEEIPATTEVQVGQNAVTYDENGRRVVQAQFIQFTAGTFAPGTVGTTTAPGDSGVVLSGVSATDDGTIRTITRSYVQATLTLVQVGSDLIDTEINGLRRRTQLFIGTAAASDPSGTVGTTTHGTDTTLILAAKKVERTATLTKAQLVWIQPGILSKRIQTQSYGLRMEAWVSIGTKQTPSGIVMSEDVSEFAGLQTWTVVCMQNATGGTPTSGSFTFEKYVPFTYPGRAKPITRTITPLTGGAKYAIEAFLSPPIETDVKATVTITYQASATIPALTYTKWQPTEWATLVADWVAWYGSPNSKVEGLRGYRSVDETAVQVSDTSGLAYSILGSRVWGDDPNDTARLQIFGGPPDPGGNTYTLDASIDLGFVAQDGTPYYRLTVIHATIPAQDSLPL